MWLSCLGLQLEEQYCYSCIIPNALVVKDVIACPSNCKPRCNNICTSASFLHFLALLRRICCGAKPADLFDETNFTRAVHTIFVKKRSSVCHHWRSGNFVLLFFFIHVKLQVLTCCMKRFGWKPSWSLRFILRSAEFTCAWFVPWFRCSTNCWWQIWRMVNNVRAFRRSTSPIHLSSYIF